MVESSSLISMYIGRSDRSGLCFKAVLKTVENIIGLAAAVTTFISSTLMSDARPGTGESLVP
jgi:uncharacterized membrane protein